MKKYRLSVVLFVLVISTFLLSVSTIDVLGSSNTLDFTFESDVLYSESNPDYDSIFNVRNQTEYTGNYPATYSFENEPNGQNGTNINFINYENLDINPIIINDYLHHNKVLKITGQSGGVGYRNYFVQNIDDCTIEFWYSANDSTKGGYWYFRNIDTSTSVFYIRMHNTFAIGTGGGTMVYDSWDADVWYHLKVVVEPTFFNFYINGIKKGTDHTYLGAIGTGIDAVYGETYIDKKDYIDAIGYSWDETSYTSDWFDLSGEGGTEPLGITWDGDSFWVCDDTISEVSQYSSVGVYTGEHFDTSGQDIYPMGITWDGDSFWVVGSNTDEVYQYTDVGVYTGEHFDVGAQDGNPTGITWDNDSFWVVGKSTAEVYQYTSAGVYTTIHFDVGSQDTNPSDITWDGDSFWVIGYDSMDVYQYTNAGVYTGTHFDVIDTDIAQEGIVWVDGYFWLTGLGNVKAYEYEYIEYPYNIGDNMIPLIETNESVIEVDRWEFSHLENGEHAGGTQDIAFWTEVNGTKYSEYGQDELMQNGQARVESAFTSDVGFYKDDFSIQNGFINITWNMYYDYAKVVDGIFYVNIYSQDTNLKTRFRFHQWGSDSHKIITMSYYNGTNYHNITNLERRINFNFSLFITPINMISLRYNDSLLETFFGITTDLGLSKIEFIGNAGENGDDELELIQHIFFDYVGVYSNGSSLSNDYMWSEIWINEIWDSNVYNLFYTAITGMCSISANDFLLYSEYNYSGTEIFNVWDLFTGDPELGGDWLPDLILYISTNDTFEVSSIIIGRVILTEGENDYILEFSYGNIKVNESFFYVDSSNRLRFSLIANDDNLEYIQAVFDIQNIATENRSISFYSNINGNSKGFFALDYESATSTTIELPYYARVTNVILTQTESIDNFTILITDNDLDNDDTCEGYITGISLIYYPDLATTITSLNLLAIIVPLIILIAPPLALEKKFGSKVILPMFILMAIICVVTKLIPVWLFFIIAFGSIGFIFMKDKVSVGGE